MEWRSRDFAEYSGSMQSTNLSFGTFGSKEGEESVSQPEQVHYGEDTESEAFELGTQSSEVIPRALRNRQRPKKLEDYDVRYVRSIRTVSYTHLTLPTILRV